MDKINISSIFSSPIDFNYSGSTLNNDVRLNDDVFATKDDVDKMIKESKKDELFTEDVLKLLLEDKINEEYERCKKEAAEEELDEKRAIINELILSIKKVMFNKNATIVFWNTGEKTVVKCQKGETFDKEKGLALCLIKYLYGNIGYYNEIFKAFDFDKSFDEKGEPKTEYTPNKKAIRKGLKSFIKGMF